MKNPYVIKSHPYQSTHIQANMYLKNSFNKVFGAVLEVPGSIVLGLKLSIYLCLGGYFFEYGVFENICEQSSEKTALKILRCQSKIMPIFNYGVRLIFNDKTTLRNIGTEFFIIIFLCCDKTWRMNFIAE